MKDHLFLDACHAFNVFLVPCLESGESCCSWSLDESSAAAGCVKKDLVKAVFLRKPVCAVLGDNSIQDATASEVCNQAIDAVAIMFICNDDSFVLHEHGKMGCFSSGCCAEVEDNIMCLGIESDAGDE